MRMRDELRPWRCGNCGNMLARLDVRIGTVEIKCGHCNLLQLREASVSAERERKASALDKQVT